MPRTSGKAPGSEKADRVLTGRGVGTRAAGRFRDFPVDISLSGSYRATANGPFAYTEITPTYTGPRPTVYVTVKGEVVATHPATWSRKLPPDVAT